ncbi:unnamed protein product, partial [Sphagnum compactum]
RLFIVSESDDDVNWSDLEIPLIESSSSVDTIVSLCSTNNEEDANINYLQNTDITTQISSFSCNETNNMSDIDITVAFDSSNAFINESEDQVFYPSSVPMCEEGSSQASTTPENNLNILMKRLSIFCSKPEVSRENKTYVLHMLNDFGLQIPRDPRTLLEKTQKIIPKQIVGGHYMHLGILKNLQSLATNWSFLRETDEILIDLS